MNGEFKKDYEPYQTMGPLCGIFDQRAAERLNHRATRPVSTQSASEVSSPG